MEWHLIEKEPLPNDVFDVLAKYYDASSNKFLVERITNCVQVDGYVRSMINGEARFLLDCGFRPIYWMELPTPPKELEDVINL